MYFRFALYKDSNTIDIPYIKFIGKDITQPDIYQQLLLNDNYYITPLLIPKETGCKDFSELFRKYGIKHIYEMIINLINTFEEYDKRIQRNQKRQTSNALPY